MKLRLTARAVRNLGHMADYLSARNPAASDRVVLALQESLELIRTHPQAGRRQRRGLRRFSHPRYPYPIFYRADEANDVVEIITVQHAARSPFGA